MKILSLSIITILFVTVFFNTNTGFAQNETTIIPHFIIGDPFTLTFDSPLKQFKSGTDPYFVTCRQDLELVINPRDGSPACVKSTSLPRLLKQGWEYAHDNNGKYRSPEDIQKIERDPLDERIESDFNSKNRTGLVALKTHEEVDIIFTSSELSTRQDSDGYLYFGINDGNKLITDSVNFTANELPKTFTFSFTPQNTGIFSFTKGIWFNSDHSYKTESEGVIVLAKFSKAMAFNGQCKKPFPEFTLILKPDFSTGACVKMDSVSVLKERGWH